MDVWNDRNIYTLIGIIVEIVVIFIGYWIEERLKIEHK